MNKKIQDLAAARDAALGLWQTEREIYGVALDETERALQEAMRDLSREQRKQWGLRNKPAVKVSA